jgi:hypothetical protein
VRLVMRPVVLAAGLWAALALVGCGGENPGTATTKTSTPTTSSTTSTSTTSTTTTTTTLPCTFSGRTTPQQNALASEVQYLTNVTVAANGCVDVLTFEFRGSAIVAPSYQISYEPGPFLNTAGQEVRPAGSAFLKVRFAPAWIVDVNQQDAPLTYVGPREITASGTNVVRGLALFDASEAVVGWVVGIDGQRPFRVDATAGKVVVTLGP